MDIPSLITNALILADKIMASAESTVQHYPWVRADSTFGKPVYGTPVPRQALVDFTVKEYFLPDGTQATQRAVIGFLQPVFPNGAAGRIEPIDMRDKFVLPNGYTGPILKLMMGLINPNTGAPYSADVMLG